MRARLIATPRINGPNESVSSASRILVLIDLRFGVGWEGLACVTSVMTRPDLEDVEIVAILMAVLEPIHPLNGEEDPQAADFPFFQRLGEIRRVRHLHRARIERRRLILQRDDESVAVRLAAD
jgi:hypothetical protein